MRPCPHCGHSIPPSTRRNRPRKFCTLTCYHHSLRRTPRRPQPRRDDVDFVTIDRLTAGYPTPSTITERIEATRILTDHGWSAAAISRALQITPRTVHRYRFELSQTRKVAA